MPLPSQKRAIILAELWGWCFHLSKQQEQVSTKWRSECLGRKRLRLTVRRRSSLAASEHRFPCTGIRANSLCLRASALTECVHSAQDKAERHAFQTFCGMCVCTCVCMCVVGGYVCMCAWLCVQGSVPVCMYVCACACECTHECMHVCIGVCACAWVHGCMCMCMGESVCKCVHACVCVCVHECTCGACGHAHAYVCPHTPPSFLDIRGTTTQANDVVRRC